MRAADIIVTKAGPGTIAEALNANLPIILYAKLPGQEDGNVTFVESEGAGDLGTQFPIGCPRVDALDMPSAGTRGDH